MKKYFTTIQWEMTNASEYISTSKSHFTEDNQNTICGTEIPFNTASDISGTGGSSVSCKRCSNKANKLIDGYEVD